MEICDVSGDVGLSVGVYHAGQVVHRANFGYRDLERKIAPDSDTIYPIASLTKAMTAAAFGILVDDGKLSWDSLVMDACPEFRQANESVKSEATITDLLAHRTGLARKNCYWHQSRQKFLLLKHETASTMSLLEQVGSLHDSSIYDNWVYAFAGIVFGKIAGESLGTFLQKQIFDPLSLKRTTIGVPPSENLAKSYTTLDDGTPWEVPNPETRDNTIMGSASGGKSSVNDLLRFYSSFMSAAIHQINHDCTTTAGSPFRQAKEMIQQQIIAAASNPHSQAYGLRLVLTELPSALGLTGLNLRELGEDMPIVGRNTRSRSSVWYHNGSLPGAFSSVYMLPDSDAVIVVLSNTLARTDTPYWLGQLLVESIIGEKQPHDFYRLQKELEKFTYPNIPDCGRRWPMRSPAEWS